MKLHELFRRFSGVNVNFLGGRNSFAATLTTSNIIRPPVAARTLRLRNIHVKVLFTIEKAKRKLG